MIEIEFRYQPAERHILMSVKNTSKQGSTYDALCTIRQPNLNIRRRFALIHLHLDISERRNSRRRRRHVGKPTGHGRRRRRSMSDHIRRRRSEAVASTGEWLGGLLGMRLIRFALTLGDTQFDGLTELDVEDGKRCSSGREEKVG